MSFFRESIIGWQPDLTRPVKPHLLWVDRNISSLKGPQQALERVGWQCTLVSSGSKALEFCKQLSSLGESTLEESGLVSEKQTAELSDDDDNNTNNTAQRQAAEADNENDMPYVKEDDDDDDEEGGGGGGGGGKGGDDDDDDANGDEDDTEATQNSAMRRAALQQQQLKSIAAASGSKKGSGAFYDDEPATDTRLLYIVTSMKRTAADSGLEFIKRVRKIPGCQRIMIVVFSASTQRDAELKNKCIEAAGGKRLVAFFYRARDVVEHSRQFCRGDPDGGPKGRSELTPHACLFRSLMSVPKSRDPVVLLVSSVFSPIHRGHQSMIRAVTTYFTRYFPRAQIAAVMLSPMADGPGKERLLLAGHPAAAFLPLSTRATLTQVALLDMPEIPGLVDLWEGNQDIDNLTPDSVGLHLYSFIKNRGEPEHIKVPRVLIVMGDDRLRDDPSALDAYRAQPGIGLVIVTRGVGGIPPHIEKIMSLSRQEQWDAGIFVVPALEDTITSDQVLQMLVLGGRIEEVLHPRVASFYYARRAIKEAQMQREAARSLVRKQQLQQQQGGVQTQQQLQQQQGGPRSPLTQFPPPPPEFRQAQLNQYKLRQEQLEKQQRAEARASKSSKATKTSSGKSSKREKSSSKTEKSSKRHHRSRKDEESM